MSEAFHHQLLVLTRYPAPGFAKTRLISSLGKEGAADLHRQMTEHLLAEARKLLAIHPVSVRIFFEGGDRQRMQTWLGSEWGYVPQQDGDLGQRMCAAFARAFRDEPESAVLVGTDVPDLTAPILFLAFQKLKGADLVLGPAEDGGYYLIGLRRSVFGRAAPGLFSGVAWSTSSVLDQTLAVAEELGLSWDLTDRLEDVDRPEDVRLWERHQRARATASEDAWISVIVPALDEADCIDRTLASIPKRDDLEVIVVDGGSTDGTPELAAKLGARVAPSSPPRARQLNLGAAVARGTIYVFLHADTLLPDGFEDQVRQVCATPSFAAGAFSLKIDSARRGIRAVERVANLRSRYLSLPYGDQALFVNARLFWEVGGFPLMPIMEDFALVRCLARRGRIAIIDRPALTSGRRWEHLGVTRTWLLNQWIVLAYYLGFSPETLARWYRGRRSPRG